MRATILTPTARRTPQWQWMADSLLNAGIHYHDTEWVVIDAQLWNRPDERRAEFEQATERLRNAGVPIVHLPPKPCRWQGPARLTKSDMYALSAARNSGLVVARGERVILLDDCTVVDEDWLRLHLSAAPQSGVCGSFFTYRTARVVGGRVLDGDPGPYGLDSRVSMCPEPGRTNGAWAFGLNASFPIEAAIAANGYDEGYDGGGGGSEDCDGGIRMERSGYMFFWSPACRVYQILETHEEIFGTATWGMERKAKKGPKEAVVRRDGQPHFRNELWIERLLLDDLQRTQPLGNPFSLREMREHYARTGEYLSHPIVSDKDFDGEPLAQMGEAQEENPK